MSIKKVSYLILLSLLHSPINLIASNNYFKKIYESLDRNILRPGLWRNLQHEAKQREAEQTRRQTAQIAKLFITADHESGHVLQAIQYPTTFKDFNYVTRLPRAIAAGHMKMSGSGRNANIDDITDAVGIMLAGAAADLISANKPLFNNNQDILTYLQNPCYTGDTKACDQLIELANVYDSEINIDKNQFLIKVFQKTYQDQLNQSNNRLTIADKLMEKGTLSALDIYKLLNTYPYVKTHIASSLTQLSKDTSKEERFYPSGNKYSKAIYKKNQLVNVIFYTEDGLQKPKFIVDEQKQALLCKTYTEQKITTREHELNGEPKIGPVRSKSYKYGYDNNLQYVGYKGNFNKYGRDRKNHMAELD